MGPNYRMLALILIALTFGKEATAEAEPDRFAAYGIVSVQEAAEEYKEIQATIQELSKKGGDRQVQCSAGFGHSGPCIETERGEAIFLPPFIAVLPDQASSGSRFGWAPVYAISDGEGIFRKWQEQAARAELFNCNIYNLCTIIVPTSQVNGLAACKIEIARDGKTGAPRYCRAIAVRDDNHIFLQIVSKRETPPQASGEGRRDFDLEIVGLGAELFPRLKTIAIDALSAQPLNLAAEIHASGDVLGVASYRRSDVLPGWREIVTIRLEFLERSPNSSGIEVASTLYVSRQNTDRPYDWTLPSREQEALWIEAVRVNLRKGLSTLCKKPLWRDTRVLLCN